MVDKKTMRRLDLVCCPDPLEGLGDTTTVFCLGPIKGSSTWQHELPKLSGVTWLSPRRLDYEFFDYDSQVSWETKGIRVADILLFWIPSPSVDVPGRSYAQTSRIEFGELLGRHEKQVVFGCYDEYPGRNYLERKIHEYYGDTKKLHNNLPDLLSELRGIVAEKQKPKIFFTSDTHFGSQRCLELSKRPFQSVSNMDWTMISRWNSVVGPSDVVYHLGDFGESWPTDYLNGKIKFIRGNYERSGKSETPRDVEVLGDTYITPEGYVLSHEPLLGKTINPDSPHLFGHIHGRQKIKSWGGLDVGMDANGFYPISLEDVEFYLNAIYKGYYDSEVWA